MPSGITRAVYALGDGGLLVGLILLIPVVIILLGLPIVLLVRGLLEIVNLY